MVAANTDHMTGWDTLSLAIIAAFVLGLLWILTRD